MDKIYIDTRESSTKLFDAFDMLSIQEGIGYEKACLDCGDVVYGNICIERKEANDFASSIMDGRIREQTAKMNLKYPNGYKYVIIEGDPYKTKSAISHNAIIGKFTSLLIKHNIRLLFVSNTDEFAYACFSLIKKHIQNNEFKPEEFKKLSNKIPDEEVVVAMIHQIPGIGYEKAQLISKMFNDSFITLVNKITKEDLMRIEGIGEKTAEKIFNIIKR